MTGTDNEDRREGQSERRSTESSTESQLLRSSQAEESPAAAEKEANARFPIVGVGASAGGLEAFTQLVRALPDDTGMAFVLVQHLAPEHESVLADLLSRATSMPVREVADEPVIERNRVYVIPPNRGMLIESGRLRLLPREARGKHHPIDQFFRSLAEHHRDMAIGVVLSGTATDGTLGLEEIKSEGGITFAQDDTAQHPGMPQSAAASGCVDFVLPPSEIAAEIGRIASHPFLAARGSGTSAESRAEAAAGKEALAPVFHHLRATTRVDFTQYKVNTLSRRIRRRMVLLKLNAIDEYAGYLAEHAEEVQALYEDILINVTGFFRDPEMFEALRKKAIPALLEGRSRHDPIRVWVLGCSTGEEAYSIAILLSEEMERATGRPLPQVFATDLNASGIAKARAGVYSADRVRDVSRDRLRRFFVEQNGQFRVAKSIRDMCVFSQHNALADPPFSRMDLVSCRNLLIYLEPLLQQRVIPVLHYALKPKGFLVLGASETVGPFRDLFAIVDGKHKVFAKQPGSGRLPLFPTSGGRSGIPLDPSRPRLPSADAILRASPASSAADLQKAADRLLLAFAPAAVLVDRNLEILHFRGKTDAYLVTPQGKPTHSLLKMAREGLLVPLQTLLRRAKQEDARVREEGVSVRTGDGYREVVLEVVPVRGTTEEGCFLVLFEDAALPTRPRDAPSDSESARSDAFVERETSDANAARLEHELASSREYARALVEQYDATNDELQSANEEAQSANEELQSINEELETSKEEIQSSNEELTTLNDELHNRNQELGQLSNDLTNLIASVQVAIVIVGRDLRIRRFSPMAERLLNLHAADVGRPLTDNKLMLVLPELEALLVETIDKVSPREREVEGKDGRWYSVRIHPYRTIEHTIDGAVLVMIDVTAIRRGREYAESIIATVPEPLLVLDDELRVRGANAAYYATFAVGPEETKGRLVHELGNGQWDVRDLRRLLRETLSARASVEGFVVEHDFEHIGTRVMRLRARRLVTPGDDRESILLVIQDETDRSRAEKSLRESEQHLTLELDAAEELQDISAQLIESENSEELYDGIVDAAAGIMRSDMASMQVLDEREGALRLSRWRGFDSTYAETFELCGPEARTSCAVAWQRKERVIVPDVDACEFIVGTSFLEAHRRVGIRASQSTPLISRRGEFLGILTTHWREPHEPGMTELRLLDVLARQAADLVERSRADAALRESEERFRTLVAIITNVSWSTDANGAFVREQASWESYTGQSWEEHKGHGWLNAIHPEDRDALRELWRRALGERTEYEASGRLWNAATSAYRRFETRATPILDVDGSVREWIGACTDVEEQTRAEDVIAKRNEELRTADGDKNNFLAILSHELRSPLNAIRGWVTLLQRPDVSPESLQQGLAVIDRQSRAQAELIGDLMDVHRIVSGKIRLETAVIDLGVVVSTALEAVSPAVAEKHLTLERDLDAEPATMIGDANRLQQVFCNLLANSIKFTPRNGTIRVGLRRVAGRVEVKVEDDGEGIAPEAVPHLFERFRQADPSTSRSHDGLGLGLSIVKQLVELHGGTIEGKSPGRGRGATFSVTLPLRAAVTSRAAQVIVGSVGEAPPPGLGGLLVLIADDEIDAREPLRRTLEEAGAEVVTVGTASDALSAIRMKPPDVLVSDIGMPGQDGYELVRALRALPPDRGGRIPAVALTAFGSSEDRKRALRAGFDVHLSKPVESDELLRTLASLASSRSGRADAR